METQMNLMDVPVFTISDNEDTEIIDLDWKDSMEQMSSSFKMNEDHWDLLLSFMEEHPSFAKGLYAGINGKVAQKKLWEELANQLNSLGYGCKPVSKWQKSWTDMKYTLKKKEALYKKMVIPGYPYTAKNLTPWEARASAILGRRSERTAYHSSKMNSHHWEVMTNFMEKHPKFAKGQLLGPNGKLIQRKLWEELTEQLNSLGFGSRPFDRWRQTWADIKYTIKKKQLAILTDEENIALQLTPWEEKVCLILGRSCDVKPEKPELPKKRKSPTFKMKISHWNILIDYMQKHPKLARAEFKGRTGKYVQRKLWEELAGKLNAIGLGNRPVYKWQKSWTDIKYLIRKKIFANSQILANGGDLEDVRSLNPWEDKISGVLEGKNHEEDQNHMYQLLADQAVDNHSVSACEDAEYLQLLEEQEVDKHSGSSACDDAEYARVAVSTKKLDDDEAESPQKNEYLVIKIVGDEDDEALSRNGDHEEPRLQDEDNGLRKPKIRKKAVENSKTELYEETIREIKHLKEAVVNINSTLKDINSTLQELKNIIK